MAKGENSQREIEVLLNEDYTRLICPPPARFTLHRPRSLPVYYPAVEYQNDSWNKYPLVARSKDKAGSCKELGRMSFARPLERYADSSSPPSAAGNRHPTVPKRCQSLGPPLPRQAPRSSVRKPGTGVGTRSSSARKPYEQTNSNSHDGANGCNAARAPSSKNQNSFPRRPTIPEPPHFLTESRARRIRDSEHSMQRISAQSYTKTNSLYQSPGYDTKSRMPRCLVSREPKTQGQRPFKLRATLTAAPSACARNSKEQTPSSIKYNSGAYNQSQRTVDSQSISNGADLLKKKAEPGSGSRTGVPRFMRGTMTKSGVSSSAANRQSAAPIINGMTASVASLARQNKEKILQKSPPSPKHEMLQRTKDPTPKQPASSLSRSRICHLNITNVNADQHPKVPSPIKHPFPNYAPEFLSVKGGAIGDEQNPNNFFPGTVNFTADVNTTASCITSTGGDLTTLDAAPADGPQDSVLLPDAFSYGEIPDLLAVPIASSPKTNHHLSSFIENNIRDTKKKVDIIYQITATNDKAPVDSGFASADNPARSADSSDASEGTSDTFLCYAPPKHSLSNGPNGPSEPTKNEGTVPVLNVTVTEAQCFANTVKTTASVFEVGSSSDGGTERTSFLIVKDAEPKAEPKAEAEPDHVGEKPDQPDNEVLEEMRAIVDTVVDMASEDRIELCPSLDKSFPDDGANLGPLCSGLTGTSLISSVWAQGQGCAKKSCPSQDIELDCSKTSQSFNFGTSLEDASFDHAKISLGANHKPSISESQSLMVSGDTAVIYQTGSTKPSSHSSLHPMVLANLGSEERLLAASSSSSAFKKTRSESGSTSEPSDAIFNANEIVAKSVNPHLGTRDMDESSFIASPPMAESPLLATKS